MVGNLYRISDPLQPVPGSCCMLIVHCRPVTKTDGAPTEPACAPLPDVAPLITNCCGNPAFLVFTETVQFPCIENIIFKIFTRFYMQADMNNDCLLFQRLAWRLQGFSA